MDHAAVAVRLNHSQRELLVSHVDGAVDVPAEIFVTKAGNARKSLVSIRLIHFDRPSFPKRTFITEDGRAVLAAVLGNYADALVRAGYTGLASPVEEPPRPITVKALEPA